MSTVALSLRPSNSVWNAMTKRDEHNKFLYVWVIEDTERIFPIDKEIRSPRFTITGISNTDFEIVCTEIYGKHSNYTRCLHIKLHPVNGNIEYNIAVDLEVTIGDQKQRGKLGDIGNSQFIKKEGTVCSHLFPNACPINSTYTNWFGQQSGSTSITLGFSFCTPGKLITTTMKATQSIESKKLTVTKDLKILLESKELSDITIQCKKTELKCHSHILYARSVYFARLFSSDMLEMKNKKIEIVDFEPETVDMMLEYLYTGDVDTTDKDIGDLLALADKYQLTELRTLASERLSDQVTDDNVLDVFILAVNHGAEDLKQFALNKVVGNKATLMNNEEFRKKLLECPSDLMPLVIELLTK